MVGVMLLELILEADIIGHPNMREASKILILNTRKRMMSPQCHCRKFAPKKLAKI